MKILTGGIKVDDDNVGLKHALIFATGLAGIPVLGFDTQPTLGFIHPGEEDHECEKGCPKPNTCGLKLRIPILRDYSQLKTVMENSLLRCTTFTSE